MRVCMCAHVQVSSSWDEEEEGIVFVTEPWGVTRGRFVCSCVGFVCVCVCVDTQWFLSAAVSSALTMGRLTKTWPWAAVMWYEWSAASRSDDPGYCALQWHTHKQSQNADPSSKNKEQLNHCPCGDAETNDIITVFMTLIPPKYTIGTITVYTYPCWPIILIMQAIKKKTLRAEFQI